MNTKKTSHVLSREMMENGGLADIISRDSAGQLVWTEKQREESLQKTLLERPEGDVWLFAYGSLIWNPTIHFVAQRIGTIHDWHRSFCLSVTAGRGSPQQPGLVLALDNGGHCTGIAYRIDDEILENELRVLWQREMVSGSYIPRWLPIFDEQGENFGHALSFTMDHESRQYAGDLPECEIVHRIAHAEGALGSAADYLLHTCEGLKHSNIEDNELFDLTKKVLAAKITPEF